MPLKGEKLNAWLKIQNYTWVPASHDGEESAEGERLGKCPAKVAEGERLGKWVKTKAFRAMDVVPFIAVGEP